MGRLQGRVALVTGASRRAGIGFAILRRFIEEGARVFAQGWTPHDLGQPWGGEADSGEAMRIFGEKVEYLEADFADPNAPRAVVNAAQAAFGHVDVLRAKAQRIDDAQLGLALVALVLAGAAISQMFA